MTNPISMSKSERVLATLRHESVDRTPVSFWFHLGTEDSPPHEVANAALELLELFDLDWLKVMHDYPFGHSGLIGSITTASEFESLEIVKPDEGGFARQHEVLQLIGDALDNEVMFIDTILSPWIIANILCSGRLCELIQQDKRAVVAGLNTITASLSGYIPTIFETGASGIFYAVDADAAGSDRYMSLAKHLDQQLLRHAASAPFNVLHLHGSCNSLAPFIHLKSHAISLDTAESQLSIRQARSSYAGAIMGGINETAFSAGASPDDIQNQVHQSIRDTNAKGLLLAPGCAIGEGVIEEQLWAVRAAVDSYKIE